MNIPTSGLPAFWAFFAALIGVMGILAAFRAWIMVLNERQNIIAAKNALMASESWTGAHSASELELDQWLAVKGIKPDSYISDIVRACWAAWLGGRAASLTELHTLVARRERSRFAAKLSSGIAALLLIIGIVGTLSSVKPILKAFQFKVSTDGEIQGAAESTELINSLLSNLGDAFWPSLVALFFTVLVVSVRGIYLMCLHQFSLELDRFAIGTILPRYRLPSISDEYDAVKRTLGELAESISAREKNFSTVVDGLKNLSESLHPVIMALERTAKTSDEAAERLSSRSQSIADGLTRTLGGNSPIYKAIKGFDGIFERTASMLESLSIQIESLDFANRKERTQFIEFIDEFKAGMRAISEGYAADRRNEAETASVIKDAMSQGLRNLQAGLTQLEEHQKRSTADSNDNLRIQVTKTLSSIVDEARLKVKELTQAGAAIPATLEKLEKALVSKSNLEEKSIQLLSDQAAKSSVVIKAAAEKLESVLATAPFIQPIANKSRDGDTLGGFSRPTSPSELEAQPPLVSLKPRPVIPKPVQPPQNEGGSSERTRKPPIGPADSGPFGRTREVPSKTESGFTRLLKKIINRS